MFFRRKRNRDDDIRDEFQVVKATVEGTEPAVVEEDREVHQSLTVRAPDGGTLMSADAAVRLFPGFEREDFEVGFAPEDQAPSLVMRWKDGGNWFTVPPMFNRAVLSAMDERDSANDLTRLLRSYGYDVEPAV